MRRMLTTEEVKMIAS